MLRNLQYRLNAWPCSLRSVPAATLIVATLLAGCSADIARLDQPNYGLAQSGPIPPEPIGRSGAGGPSAYDNSGWADSGSRAGSAPTPGSHNDRVASLPAEDQPAANPSRPFDTTRGSRPAAVTPAPAVHRPGAVPVVAGATIEVQPGDTLYALSKRHHVSIAALMDVNGLKNATLKPGQKIRLPANARHPITRAEAPVPVVTPGAALGQPPVPMASAPIAGADWGGSYTVKAGDSLYGIARAHRTTSAELQRVNGIADPRRVKPGVTLKVPTGSASEAAPAATDDVRPAGGVHLLNPPPGPPTSAAEVPEALSTKVAGLGPVAVPTPPASTPAMPVSAKFEWPAKGKLLAGFGPRPDGGHNDGVNIAVPAGTDIKAAEAGTVAYAGGEIKAYGNLILIRHEGGWVTAYAHAEQLLVKRGDNIKRGQVIGKAGATGSVDQPQVHFELRQGSKPIDPTPHMAAK